MLPLDASDSTSTPSLDYAVDGDTVIALGDVAFGPLAERILSALIQDHVVPLILDEDDGGKAGVAAPPPGGRTAADMMDLDSRIRSDARHLGCLDEEEGEAETGEDDEVLRELLQKQEELREQVALNEARKKRLREVAQKWMGWQEYNAILDEINRNIETAYVKRFRSAPKSKGKKKPANVPEYRVPMAETVITYMENRKRMIRDIGAFLNPERFRIPDNSIYDDVVVAEEEARPAKKARK
ncbi:histone acetyltransferases subunit 3-domain-containing protein [Blyttiomyces helicus]|uniref:Histone acetyltransferases subunit 3-domain-containing protein n=1 Tax=Blyttiomyces helicus TaxID=388810 RepID=A0A4P9W093_9FUNG|nr:histone acetyltransferases subunit 3-domain-containing protein [Blyttiomyces helicus]|eukprot:RKO83436.1 histone acetyltransferases subunit 3-domain-containing protein [Blyttiomyces helicus]